jgi:phosphatidylserine decarboxylase
MDNFSWPDPPHLVAFPIARPGYPLIFAAAFITVVFALLELTFPALIGLVITLFICWFFRDPDRVVPKYAGAVVSPADGRIVVAGKTDDNPLGEGPCMKVSVFMTVFNVHVNRVPHEGTITRIVYRPGGYQSAGRDKASVENERNMIFLKAPSGKLICVVQIAGLIARRIICKVQAGDALLRGQRLGMICFGSRLDVYLPPETTLNVKKDDHVKAGTTILGYL